MSTTVVPPSSASSVGTTAAPQPVVAARLEAVAPSLGFAGSRGLTGGLGHEIVQVTTTNDDGPGSYREALSAGGRIVRFSPSLDGETIHLLSPVEVSGSDITVDGSGVDVTVAGHATRFSGTNVVVAGMTFRYNDDLDEDDAVTFREATRTQVAGLFGNRFESASDGLVDVIWNQGNDVFVTMCGNAFAHHDKAVLIDSGDDEREGGRYHVTMCHNSWVDVFQRAPLSRRAYVHQYNSLFERYGDPDGNGGGSKAGGDGVTGSAHLLEGNIAIPRAVGETTFGGGTAERPRTEWAGPQLGNDSAVRIEGTLLATVGEVTATETESRAGDVADPPYEYQLVAATRRLAEVLRATAGVCVPVQKADAVSPCAPLVFVGPVDAVTVQIDGDVDEVVSVVFEAGGATVAASVDPDDPGRWSVAASALGSTATPVSARVTTSDGSVTSSDVVVLAVVESEPD